jgi:hypothetical protein
MDLDITIIVQALPRSSHLGLLPDMLDVDCIVDSLQVYREMDSPSEEIGQVSTYISQ